MQPLPTVSIGAWQAPSAAAATPTSVPGQASTALPGSHQAAVHAQPPRGPGQAELGEAAAAGAQRAMSRTESQRAAEAAAKEVCVIWHADCVLYGIEAVYRQY